MINLETLLTGLMITSTVTGLATEAVKKCLTDLKVKYQANILTGIVSIVVSAGIGVGYLAITGTAVSGANITGIIGLAFASWLCSMVGYDKVKQGIEQLKNVKKG
jgi:hypothetical protein